MIPVSREQIEDVFRTVARNHGVTVRRIRMGRACVWREVVAARKDIAIALRTRYQMTVTRIARELCLKDHSPVCTYLEGTHANNEPGRTND